MKKIKWLKAGFPISSGELRDVLLTCQYSQDTGSGFTLEIAKASYLKGQYFERKIEKATSVDPFGNEITNDVVSFYRCRFEYNAEIGILIIQEPPRSLRPFINKLSSLVGLGMELADITAKPLEWCTLMENELNQVDITNISAYGITVPPNGLAKITVSGKKDIRNEFEKTLNDRSYFVDSVKFSFDFKNSKPSIELTKTGAARVAGYVDESLISLLTTSLLHQVK